MSEHTPLVPASRTVDSAATPVTANGCQPLKASPEVTSLDSPRGKKGDHHSTSDVTAANTHTGTASNPKCDEEDAASEAETVITSPVKKREAARQSGVIKTEKPLRSRIGGLPVPGEDDESSVASPMPSTEASAEKPGSGAEAPAEDTKMTDNDADDNIGSDLSSARSSPSRASSRSRALSEGPENTRHGESPNPRKRKYRASSASLPESKRQIVDHPRSTRNLRGLNSEETRPSTDRSASPKLRNHRRTISTQSALDTTVDSRHRKRRAANHVPERELKSSKTEWADSDVSSETTSRAGDDSKRPQRQVARSTSTPGRPPQREPKRHINKYGFTRLAEACENGDLDAVKEWRIKDPDQVEVAEFAGNKPLQIAALKGNAEVVDYLIKEGCQIDCANVDKDTPLIDAAENGHLEVVKLLLDAGVDPLRQNVKGQQALDVVTDDIDDAREIRAALREAIERWNSDGAKQRREEEEIQRHRGGPSKELHFMVRTYENLLKLVTINDRNGVQEFLDARVPVDNAIIAAAAKTGDSYLLSMLLAEITEKKAYQKPEKPMLAVLGTSHFEMVKLLTELDQFNPLWRSRQNKTWAQIAEERNGPMWRQEKELLQRLYDQHAGNTERRSSSPISKRDSNGKRRAIRRQSADESDDGESSAAPKRKNGRRLMSRKDMRAAGSKIPHLESSDGEDDSSDDGAGNDGGFGANNDDYENTMRPPPDAPSARRTSGRARSNSSQKSEPWIKTRRSSVSLRSETTLPKVEENSDGDLGELESAKRDSKKHQDQTAAAEEMERETANKAELEKAEEARQAALERLENERRLEEERRAEEARIQEQSRLAEEARLAEEEARRKQREIQEAKHRLQADLLATLPPILREVFKPDSRFGADSAVDGKLATFLLQHFTPLRPVTVVSQQDIGPASAHSAHAADWILNLQAAPLLGRQGFELFLHADAVGFEGCLADRMATASLANDSLHVVDQILASLTCNSAALPYEMCEADGVRRHRIAAQRTAERYNAFVSARRRLESAADLAVLRCVRLDDVLCNLHPSLRDVDIEVTNLYTEDSTHGHGINGEREDAGLCDFVARLQTHWHRREPPRKLRSGADGTVTSSKLHTVDQIDYVNLSDAVVVHEK